jgi:arylsulfatase A-like enzyme
MPNNILFIVFDSCRYDSFVKAATPNIDRLGKTERRFSYASWTYPSHTVYMMGQTPHDNPKGVFASEVYKKEFAKWSDRLGIDDISFRAFVPRLSLPHFLKQHGYRTNALVSMPVLNQSTNLNNYFDHFQLMDSHNDFEAMIDALKFDADQPSFYLMNVGETHYPFTLKGESGEHLPRLHGLHGVFKHMDDMIAHPQAESLSEQYSDFFNMDAMKVLYEKQISNVEFLDRMFGKLYEKVPANTHIIVTADHGELFGEDGFFGHGPIIHEKVFEVPFVEGKLR